MILEIGHDANRHLLVCSLIEMIRETNGTFFLTGGGGGLSCIHGGVVRVTPLEMTGRFVKVGGAGGTN